MSKYHNANLFKKVVDGLKKGEAVMPETRKFTTAGKRKKKKNHISTQRNKMAQAAPATLPYINFINDEVGHLNQTGNRDISVILTFISHVLSA